MKEIKILVLLILTGILFSPLVHANLLHNRSIQIQSEGQNREFQISFQVDTEGSIHNLNINTLSFITDFIGDRSTAIFELGFYQKIPADLFIGTCTKLNGTQFCLIKIEFTDEEATTLFIQFSMIYFKDNKLTTHGSIFETHNDQGMPTFQNTYVF